MVSPLHTRTYIMRNSAIVIAAYASITVLVPVGLAGCRLAWRRDPCAPSSAYRTGGAQAMQGQAIDYSAGFECKGEGLETFTASFEAGYRDGREDYCDPGDVRSAALYAGTMGAQPQFQPRRYAICDVPALQAVYDSAYEEGVDLRCSPGTGEREGAQAGEQGRFPRFDAASYAMCGDARLQALAEAFERGYQNGLARHCAPERWEASGLAAGSEGGAPADIRGSLAACPAERQEVVVSRYERAYHAGLARYCDPASWQPWARDLGTSGRQAPDPSDAIGRCSAAQRDGIISHVRRGYEDGLRAYCDGSEIVDAGYEAARNGTEPRLPAAYEVCLDWFPHTQTLYASGYQTGLAWVQQQWGSTPPMMPAQLQELLQNIRNQPFADGRMTAIRNAAQYSRFLSEQVVVLMNEFAFDDSKMEVAAVLYPAVVDRANWSQVYAALGSSYSRDQLAERIAAIP